MPPGLIEGSSPFGDASRCLRHLHCTTPALPEGHRDGVAGGARERSTVQVCGALPEEHRDDVRLATQGGASRRPQCAHGE
jgi:hypothetical protein